jgi:hypothetical protein
MRLFEVLDEPEWGEDEEPEDEPEVDSDEEEF